MAAAQTAATRGQSAAVMCRAVEGPTQARTLPRLVSDTGGRELSVPVEQISYPLVLSRLRFLGAFRFLGA